MSTQTQTLRSSNYNRDHEICALGYEVLDPIADGTALILIGWKLPRSKILLPTDLWLKELISAFSSEVP
ncbi:hypothetical protein Pdw03_2425 [Penicillium digitatum]|uniref:Uncharacterized protein n=1 Tax=Penicillium digitatum TaxID=36651 RepID=A0A7T7BH47_PENDI|nr:hypothetical protein Pdw03_2425 [Penicillium digitatum]